MLLQQIQSAFFAILTVTIGGLSPWASTYSGPQDLLEGGLESAPSDIAAPPLPTYTPVPEDRAGLHPRELADVAAPPAVPEAASSPGPIPGPGPALVQGPPSGIATQVQSSSASARLRTGLEYSPESLEYFTEIGLGAEYGDSAPELHKWIEDIRIKVHGAPTSDDLEALDQVVGELNALLDGVELQGASVDANYVPGSSPGQALSEAEGIHIHFLPESQFASGEPQYVPVNLGFFRVWWDDGGAIKRARILIASQGITQQERSHLIREELTQSLGLFKDSWRYPDSIFYQGWTDTVQFSELDRAAIELLYDPRLQTGMTRSEVLDALGALYAD